MEPSQAARILEEHGRAVLHLAYSYLRSQEEAEDVLQDTLVQYIRKAPSFDSQAHERAWLLRVAANLCKNRLRAPWRHPPEIPEDYPGQGMSPGRWQFDLYGGGGDEPQSAPQLQLKNIPEFSRRELMAMEKETTGLYLTGHPMDEYRALVKQLKAASIGAILSDFGQEGGPATFRDEQRVTIAGVVTAARTKTTRNNSLMAYVTVEDDAASMEMLVFSRTLTECGPYLKEGVAILAEGRISVRDEKAPQLMCDRVRPLDQLSSGAPVEEEKAKKLYIRIPGLSDPRWARIRLILTMFPGTEQLVVKCEDTGKRLGAPCLVHRALVAELRELLGEENVVVR